jgi:hypothetical protein
MGLSGISSVRGNENCTTQMDSGPESACFGKEIEWVGIDQNVICGADKTQPGFCLGNRVCFKKKTPGFPGGNRVASLLCR